MLKRSFDPKDWISAGIILLAALVIYTPVLSPGRVLLPADLLLLTPPWSEESRQLDPAFTHVLRPVWDPLFQFYPARKFLAASLAHGWIPLWNPHAFSGTPFAADGQSAVFYPINWLFAILPLAFAFGFVAFLHTYLTGLFFYLFVRRIGATPAGGIAGALVWMLCGEQVGWQMWQVVDSTLCWLPLCLFFWEGVRRSPNSRQGVGLALAIAMTLLAGHLQFAFYVLLTVASYAVYRPVKWPGDAIIQSLLVAAGYILLGVLISCVQIFATSDLLRLGIRTSAPIEALLPSAIPPAQLGLLVMPQIFGSEQDYLNHPFLAGEYYEKVVYCGASVLVFAAFAIRLHKSGDLSRYWFGLALFSLLMGCGSLVYSVFYYALPLFKSFHGLSRALVLFDFAVAALAAQGISLLDQESPDSRKRPAQLAVFAAALFIVVAYRFGMLSNGPTIAYFLAHDWLIYGLEQAGIALVLITAASLIIFKAPTKFAWIAAALVSVDMILFASGINPGSSSGLLYPPTPETAFITQQLGKSPLDRVLCIGDGNQSHAQSRIVPNGAMSLDWNDVSGSDPLILSRYYSFVRAVNTRDTGQPEPAGQGMVAEAGDSALNLLNVHWIIGRRVLNYSSYRPALAGDVNVYENLSADGPAQLTALSLVAPASDDTSAAQANFLSDGRTNVDDLTVARDAEEAEEARPEGPLVLSENGPGRMSIFASPSTASLLTVSQTFCPGWICKIDGEERPIHVVDGLLAGVFIAPGRHTIVLSFEPAAVQVGLFVSLAGLLIAAFDFMRRSACNG